MLRSLLKIRIQSAFASTFRRKKGGKQPKILYCFIAIILLMVSISYGVAIEQLFERFAGAFANAHLGSLYFSFIGIFMFSVIILLNIFLVQSQLYESKDAETLLSLPIKPSKILLSRMLLLLLLAYFVELLIGIPAVVAYYRYAVIPYSGIICYSFAMIFMGLFSLAISCFIGWFMTMLTSRTSHRTLLQVFLSVIVMSIFTFILYTANNYLLSITQNADRVEKIFKNFIYPIYCFGNTSVSGDFLCLIKFALFSSGVFALVYLLLSKSFIKIVGTPHKFSVKNYDMLSMKKSSSMNALVKKELKLLFTNYMYFINAGIGVIFSLIIVGAVLIKGESILDLVQNEILLNKFPAAIVLVLCQINATNVISAPSISLEGGNLWIAQSLPVSGRTILLSKVITHCVVCFPATFLVWLAINIVFDMNLLFRIYTLIMPSLMIVFLGLLGVILNLKFPKFDFVNVTAAVKQSMSVLLAMLIPLVMLSVFTVIYVFALMEFFAVQYYLGIVFLIILGITFYMYDYINRNGSRLFSCLNNETK